MKAVKTEQECLRRGIGAKNCDDKMRRIFKFCLEFGKQKCMHECLKEGIGAMACESFAKTML